MSKTKRALESARKPLILMEPPIEPEPMTFRLRNKNILVFAALYEFTVIA
jgi:hypothetical protein